MSFRASPAPTGYDRANEANFRGLLERFLAGVLRTDRDVEIQPAARLILTSPNGARWAVTISNAGVLTSTAL